MTGIEISDINKVRPEPLTKAPADHPPVQLVLQRVKPPHALVLDHRLMTIIEGLKEKKMTVLGQTAALQQFCFSIEDLPLNSQSARAFRRPAGAPAACLPA